MSLNPENHKPVRHVEVAVIGGGQAGLSMSWHLKQAGISHLVFERKRCFSEWRYARWDSFCLVTPNWQCRLPGFHYTGKDPNGFMLKDEIVRYLDAYVASFKPPLLEGVNVDRIERLEDGRFKLRTTLGECTANQIVLANGVYQKPIIPRSAERIAPQILQLHSSNYRNPQSMPDGATLVVGAASPAARLPRICISPDARYISASAVRRVRHESTADARSRTGSRNLAITTSPMRTIRRRRRCARRPITTSPAAMVAARSTCVSVPWKA